MPRDLHQAGLVIAPADRILTACKCFLLATFAVLFLMKVWTTLGWRMENDPPLSHYVAFLMDRHHLFPYRDVFETCMPGTYAFHYALCKLFGYGDLAFRCVDLALLAVLLVGTYAFMRRFGQYVGVWAGLLFGLVYLSKGPLISLQRDYIGVIPVAFALLCIPATTAGRVGLGRLALVGLLFGMSVLIKPHLGIGLPVIFGALIALRWQSRGKSALDFLTCLLVAGVSLLIPVGIALLWLAANAALSPFFDIVCNYLPLYNEITGRFEVVSGRQRLAYLAQQTLTFGGYGPFLLAALAGYYHVARHPGQDKATLVSLRALFLCTLAYAIYPTLAGKFWHYHYMPLAYFGSLAATLCLAGRAQPAVAGDAGRRNGMLLLAAFLVAVAVQLPLSRCVRSLIAAVWSGPEIHVPKDGRVDEIATWLKGRLREGDTVQPLDWVGGSVHAMLLARARIATPFLYDCQFYHHVSSPYVQQLRRLFIRQMREVPPRFVIEVITNRPWVTGADTTHTFPELRRLLDAHYAVVFQRDDYCIYERTGAVAQ